MMKIRAADEKNADYGRIRMFQALQYQKEIGKLGEVAIPSEGTVRKIMEQMCLIHKPKRKPMESPKLTGKHANLMIF